MPESNAHKERVCKHCEGHLYVTAAKLVDHAKLCLIAKRSGLIIPTLIMPSHNYG